MLGLDDRLQLNGDPSPMLLSYRESGHTAALLKIGAGPWLERIRPRPVVVSILGIHSQERRAVEDFIRCTYAQSYGACIGVDWPVLMSVRDEDDNLLAALGFRYASDEPLFLEQYLDEPIESSLLTPRYRIVEIGNLASSGRGGSVFLFTALAAYLHHQGAIYAVATGTQTMEKRLRYMGLSLRRLGLADPARLKASATCWGSYYASHPNVLAGKIDEGYRRLQQAFDIEYTGTPPRLLPRLHHQTAAS